MIVINLFGAPGSGKSTTQAGLFFLMKINKFRVEMVREYAKELIWAGVPDSAFKNQVDLLGEQSRRQHELLAHDLDFMISDSPLLLPAFFALEIKGYHAKKEVEKLALKEFNKYENWNYYLERKHSFEAFGRRHDEERSEKIGEELKEYLHKLKVPFTIMDASPLSPQLILQDIERRRQKPIVQMPFKLPEA